MIPKRRNLISLIFILNSIITLQKWDLILVFLALRALLNYQMQLQQQAVAILLIVTQCRQHLGLRLAIRRWRRTLRNCRTFESSLPRLAAPWFNP